MSDGREAITPLSAAKGLTVSADPFLCSHIDIGDGMVKIHLGDGRVEFGPGYTPDEAAKLFWEAIFHQFPDGCEIRRKESSR